MPVTRKSEDVGKIEEKQNSKTGLKGKLEGKKHLIVLWTTVLGLFGTTGIPKIIELLENKPSIEQVQTMIAIQTEKLSSAQNNTADMLNQLDKELERTRDCVDRFREEFPGVRSRVELIQDVLRDCCTRRRALEKLREDPRPQPESTDTSSFLEAPSKLFKIMAPTKNKSPINKLVKVPEFKQENIQQQLQIQEFRE